MEEKINIEKNRNFGEVVETDTKQELKKLNQKVCFLLTGLGL